MTSILQIKILMSLPSLIFFEFITLPVNSLLTIEPLSETWPPASA